MATSSPKSKPLTYDVHPSIAMVQDWIAGLKSRTGRSFEEWMAFINKSGPKTEELRRDWLKSELAVGTNIAGWLAERSVGKGSDEDSLEGYLKLAPLYVEAQYAGKKLALLPIYEALVSAGRSIAKDVKVCPGKTIVPLIRNHVFAQIKPSTNTRIDLGFALGDRKATGRLIDTGGFAKKDRITHRTPILSLADIDAEIMKWLKLAYELDGKPMSRS